MLQANPDLSPFDIRNIMQETATYRRCEYMFANEPCVEDLVPKNRQNNVYGHGEVRALDAVFEAAERDYIFDDSIELNLVTEIGLDNKIHMFPDEEIDFGLSGSSASSVHTIQWRSNHLRDDWSNIHSYEHGSESGYLSAIDIIHQLEHLPGITLDGNHTISFRALKSNSSGGFSSSPLITTNIMLMDTESAFEDTEESNSSIDTKTVLIGVSASIIIALLVLVFTLYNSNKQYATNAIILDGQSDIIDSQNLDSVDKQSIWDDKK
jgi:hypothetical protein